MVSSKCDIALWVHVLFRRWRWRELEICTCVRLIQDGIRKISLISYCLLGRERCCFLKRWGDLFVLGFPSLFHIDRRPMVFAARTLTVQATVILMCCRRRRLLQSFYRTNVTGECWKSRLQSCSFRRDYVLCNVRHTHLQNAAAWIGVNDMSDVAPCVCLVR